jgi:integrase
VKAETLPKWLVRRGGKLVYRRRVPQRYAFVDSRKFVTISCETADLGKAILARDKLNSLTEAFWLAASLGESPDARDRYQSAVERARLEGFAYVPSERLLEAPMEELLQRLAALEQIIWPAGDEPSSAPPVIALLGGARDPGVTVSQLVATYEKFTRDERLKKSDEQLHKWRLPLTRAAKNLQVLTGDKALSEFTRGDAILFRDWWLERIEEEGLSMESANKDFTHLGHMISVVSDRLDLKLDRRFRGLRFKRGEAGKRPPYSSEFICGRLLASGALAGLNASARAVVLIMVETGARPSEIVALRPADIRLDHEIPHIAIDGYDGRQLKTPFSRRDLPLVGVSLEGARLLLGRNDYRDRGSGLSATINKFFEENGLRETPGHTLYSLRHSFKDRLTDVSAPDLIDSSLMGHKFDRPDYGKGPSLKVKLEWIMKIALTAGRPASS